MLNLPLDNVSDYRFTGEQNAERLRFDGQRGGSINSDNRYTRITRVPSSSLLLFRNNKFERATRKDIKSCK